jgi:hypothetical protein
MDCVENTAMLNNDQTVPQLMHMHSLPVSFGSTILTSSPITLLQKMWHFMIKEFVQQCDNNFACGSVWV